MTSLRPWRRALKVLSQNYALTGKFRRSKDLTAIDTRC